MIETELVPVNTRSCEDCLGHVTRPTCGLHMEPSMRLTDATNLYHSSIKFSRDDTQVDAKSVMQIAMLAVNIGTFFKVKCDGPDEVSALDAVADTMVNFEEGLCPHFVEFRNSSSGRYPSNLDLLKAYVQLLKGAEGVMS